MKLQEWLDTHHIAKRKLSRMIGRGILAVDIFIKEDRVHSLRDALALEKFTEGKVSLQDMLSAEDIKHIEETLTYSEMKKMKSLEERKPRPYRMTHPRWNKKKSE